MITEEKLLKLRKLADAMYYAAQYLTTDASRLHKAMDEYHKFIIRECKEEPTIPDIVDEHFYEMLGEEPASENYKNALNSVAITFLQEQQIVPNFYADIIIKAVKRGANWQKEQMMAKAVDVTIAIPYSNGDGGYTQLVYSQEALPFGENINVLVIKEE